MPILIKKKILFLAHPRTASQATVTALRKVGGVNAGAHHHAFMDAPQGETTVSTIRNPYDVLATWFQLSGYDNLNHFLTKYEHSFFKIDDRLFYFHAITERFLLYDTLASDFDCLLSDFGLEPQRLYRINTTPKKRPYQSYFDESAKEFVEELYAKDLELYRSLKEEREIP